MIYTCTEEALNIIIDYITSDTLVGVANRIIELYKPEHCYVSYFEGYLDNGGKYVIGIDGKPCYHYLLSKNALADYKGCLFEADCPPLEEKILSTMTEFEPIILKMMEREESIAKDYESRVRIYHRHLRYWNYMLDAAKIGIVVFASGVPHAIYDYIIYCLCLKKGIITSLMYNSPIYPYKVFFSEISDHCSAIASTYQHYALQYRDTPIENIELPVDFQKAFNLYNDKNNDKTPYYMKKSYLKKKTTMTNRIKSFMKRFLVYKKRLDEVGARQIVLTIISRHNKYKKGRQNKRINRIYKKISVHPDYTKQFVYLPLHYQPECSTSPLGGFYVHQLLVAQMISYHLPGNVQLYIKEHVILNSKGRDIQLYNDLLALPNVKLVHRSTNTYELLENCIAVATVTGTAGFEGMFMGKPFLIFGSHPNMYAPGAFIIRNNEDCEEALEYIMEHGAKHTQKDMKIYLKAISDVSEYCFISEQPPAGFTIEENIDCIVRGFTQVINSKLKDHK